MENPGFQDVLEEVAQRASRFSINLNGQVEQGIACCIGGFATVYKGTLRESAHGTKVAVKTVRIPGDIRQLDTYAEGIKGALHEVHAWSKLSHQNILPLLGITTDFDHTISIVSAWMEDGNARLYVKNTAVDPRPLLLGIAKGLHYLHTHQPSPIFHGDLKGLNVLISPEGRAVLTDFGFSRIANSSFSMPYLCGGGTLRWMAPEILDTGEATAAADVWAFGMTCLELFTRKDPFPQCQNTKAIQCAILKAPPDRPSPDETHSRLTDSWWNLCSLCWEPDQTLRPSIRTVVKRISYNLDPTLEIHGIELQNAKKVKSVELNINGVLHLIPEQRESHIFHAKFSPPLRLGSEEFSLFIIYKKGQPDKIPFDPFDVLSTSDDHKFRKKIGKMNTVLILNNQQYEITQSKNQGVLQKEFAQPPELENHTPSSSVVQQRLFSNFSFSRKIISGRPTTEDLLSQCPYFRILVIGKSGVGKSTLVNKVFGMETAMVAHDKAGKADINRELKSPQNDRFILHDSRGFEPGEDDNYDVAKNFIQSRKSQPDIRNQLHAIWLCFQVPLLKHGERLMDRSTEEFLKEKRKIVGDIPTIVVFTKYDRLLTMMKAHNSTSYESEAAKYLQEHCIQPIQWFTGENDFSHIAVSSKRGQEMNQKELINVTLDKVSQHFTPPKMGAPSPVPVVAMMALRISPSLKIEDSILVGKQRYWRALAASHDFKGFAIRDCLRVIHTDIVSVWNFNDPDKYLFSEEFRNLMINMVGEINELARSPTTSSTAEGFSLAVLLPITLPFIAGRIVVQWVYDTYQRVPTVQKRFMAYIVDLVHVLEILFVLTASVNEKKLTRRAIKRAFTVYYNSRMKITAHSRIRKFDFSGTRIPGRDIILDEIISLVRNSCTDDAEVSQLLDRISPADLAGDEDWDH